MSAQSVPRTIVTISLWLTPLPLPNRVNMDAKTLQKRLAVSHVSANAILRGMQLTLVGGACSHSPYTDTEA